MHAIFMSTSINVFQFYKLTFWLLAHLSWAVLLNKGEKININKNLLTFISIEIIVVNVCIRM